MYVFGNRCVQYRRIYTAYAHNSDVYSYRRIYTAYTHTSDVYSYRRIYTAYTHTSDVYSIVAAILHIHTLHSSNKSHEFGTERN